KKSVNKIILFLIISILLMFSYNLFRTSIPINELLSFGEKFTRIRNYFFVLLTFPIIEVLQNEEKKTFLRNIFFMGFFAICYRLIFWYLYNYMGINLAPGIFEERGYNWTRYGKVRLQGLFLDGFLLSYLSCYLFYYRNAKSKILYIVFLSVVLFYEVYVYASRSQLIGFLAIISMICILRDSTILKKLLELASFLIVSFVFISSSYFSNFVDSFSISNSTYGAGTKVRLIGQSYFHYYWTHNKLFGFGISRDGNIFQGFKYYLSDLGIVSFLYQFGLYGFLVTISPLIYGIYVGFRKRVSFEGILLLAVSLFSIVTSFASQNIYDYSRILILPIILGLTSSLSTKKCAENN
ncbi:TPA: hypothetical protein ACGOZY_002169, partial [Streptococcus suis]